MQTSDKIPKYNICAQVFYLKVKGTKIIVDLRVFTVTPVESLTGRKI